MTLQVIGLKIHVMKQSDIVPKNGKQLRFISKESMQQKLKEDSPQ